MARLLLALTPLFVLAWGCDGRAGTRMGPTGVGSGTGTSAPSIVGTWRRTLIVQTQTDVISSETTWVFSSGGGCERTVVTHSLLEGVPITQRSACGYQLANGRVTIQFSGSGGPVSFRVVVSGGRLFLDGVEFTKIG